MKDDDGSWAEDKGALQQVVREYFEKIFEPSDEIPSFTRTLQCVPSNITEETNNDLIRPFTLEEFKLVVYQMHPDKASGPNDFNLVFFQKCWVTI